LNEMALVMLVDQEMGLTYAKGMESFEKDGEAQRSATNR
jgi:hypothetical protein